MAVSWATKVADLRWLALGLLLAATSQARADYPVAPDVVVFCEPTLQHAVADVGAVWRSKTGIKIRLFTSPTSALLEQIAHNARDDVVIGESDAQASAGIDRHLIKKDMLQRLWSNSLVVAALNGASGGADDPHRAAGKLTAAAGKAPIAIVDPWAATAGADSEKALQSLGLWQAVSSKSMGVVGTADAAYLLAQGKVKLAIVYATDVAANPMFSVTEPLPAASYPPIIYWVAQTEHALSPNAAKFIAFLRSAEGQLQARADGLEILP